MRYKRSGQEFWGGVVPKIGRNFIQVVSIDGFPLNPQLESSTPCLNCLVFAVGRRAISSWTITSR